MVVGDGTPHCGDDLGVHQGHPGCGLAGARHVAGGVEHPARVLVAAVYLVENLQQVACRLLWPSRGIGRGVPEGAAIVVERPEPITHLLQAGAHVVQGERRSRHQVPFGRRAMPGEVAQPQARPAPRPARAGVVSARARSSAHSCALSTMRPLQISPSSSTWASRIINICPVVWTPRSQLVGQLRPVSCPDSPVPA